MRHDLYRPLIGDTPRQSRRIGLHIYFSVRQSDAPPVSVWQREHSMPKTLWAIVAAVGGLACAAGLQAHPMGNFSVSHYSRLDLPPRGARLTYILDLAELRTFELLQRWGLANDRTGLGGEAEVERHAREQAR